MVAAREPGSDGVAPELGPARGMVASEEPGSAGVAPELGPARVVPEPGSGSAPSVPVPSEGRSSVDAGVPLLKRRRTREQSGSGSVDRPGEGPQHLSLKSFMWKCRMIRAFHLRT